MGDEGDKMHVTDIESIILQHDMQEALGFAQGYYSKRTAHLLKVHTDEGIVGIYSTNTCCRNRSISVRRSRKMEVA